MSKLSSKQEAPIKASITGKVKDKLVVIFHSFHFTYASISRTPQKPKRRSANVEDEEEAEDEEKKAEDEEEEAEEAHDKEEIKKKT